MQEAYVGEFIILIDEEGRRHFVKRSAIMLIADDDVIADTCTVVAAGRVLRVPMPADDIVALVSQRS